MGISIADDIALFEGIKARVAEAVVPACNAIGAAYKEHLVDYTLIESGAHPPASATYTPPAGPPGGAPMMMTGRLRDTVVKTPAVGGGGFATCQVMPTTIYAHAVHWGGDHFGLQVLWIRYIGYATAKSKGWVRMMTPRFDHPYMLIAVAEEMANGGMSRAAAAAFEAYVWG